MVERKREKDDGLRALRRRAEGVYEQQRLGSPPGGHHRLRGSRLLIGSACAARNMCYRPPVAKQLLQPELNLQRSLLGLHHQLKISRFLECSSEA